LFSNGSTIAQDNANFFWDDVNNRLGIGTATPEQILHIVGASAIVYIDGNSAGTQTSSTLRLRTGGFNVGNFRYNVATDNIEVSNISAGGTVTSGAVKIYGTGGSTTGLTIAAAGESTFSQKIQISTGGLRIGTSATENDRLIVVNGTNLTSGSSQYLEVIAPTYTGNITNLYGRLQYATCNSGTISNAYMLYLGSWSGTSTYSNKWSIYQESTTEKNYFGSAVIIGSTTDNGNKLQVYGDSYIEKASGNASLLMKRVTNDTKFEISVQESRTRLRTWSTANDRDIYFDTDNAGTTRMVILGGGNVGIGTSSPDLLLHVEGQAGQFGSTTGYRTSKFTAKSSVVADKPGIILGYDTSGGGIIAAATESTGQPINFWTYNGASWGERMRITSGGNVGINTTTPNFKLHISTGTTTSITQPTAGTYGLYIQQNTSGSTGGLYIQDGASNSGNSIFVGDNNGAARFVVDTDGVVMIGTTNTNPAENNVKGVSFSQDGRQFISSMDNEVVRINRGVSDGVLVFFHQAGVAEGNISVSGTTVSYNGGHLSRYSQTETYQRIEGLLKGTVMSNLDKMAEWIDPKTGEPYANEQLNCMKISDVEGDVNVAGVFVNWDDDDKSFTSDMNIAMTGDMIIRIAQGVVVEKGQLLMSAGDGTAKPQEDDIVRSKTIAKVTSNHITCVYEDGSYCVPCVLMAC
jgi:hypothetical protein